MGSSILDWFNGNYTPSTQQSQEAAKYADDAYMQQTQGGMAPGANVNPWGFGNSSNQGVDAGPTNQAASRALTEYNSQTGPVTQSPWLTQGSAAQGTAGRSGATPPSYSAQGLGQMGNGVINYTGNDPALRSTLNAAGAGDMTYGTAAFGANNYSSMQNLANQIGFDTSGYKTTDSLRIALDDRLKDYFMVKGLSQGWNDTGNARGANGTLYQRQGDQLNPVSTMGYVQPDKGNWVQEHPGILAPLGVAAGGLAAMYSAPAAGASGGAATAGGASTGAAAAGTAGAGAGTSGISGAIANGLGLGSQWGALPAWGQGAISGATMGGAQAGIRGGNILQGALMGGLSGGVGGGITSGLGDAGVNSSLAGAAGRLGGGVVAGLAGGNTNLAGLLQNGVINAGAGYAGQQLGLGGVAPTDNSLGAIMARLAAQQGGSYLAEQLDPRLRGLGGQAGGSLAALFQNRYS